MSFLSWPSSKHPHGGDVTISIRSQPCSFRKEIIFFGSLGSKPLHLRYRADISMYLDSTFLHVSSLHVAQPVCEFIPDLVQTETGGRTIVVRVYFGHS